MRPYLLSSILVLLSACSFDAKGVTESTQGSQSGSDSTGTVGSATEVAPTSTGTSSGSVGETEGMLCNPGATGPCDCPGGGSGTHECAADGMSFGACDCPAVTATDSTATTDETTTMTDPSTTTTTMGTDPMTSTMSEETTMEGTTSGTTTGDESSSSSGEPPPMCKDDGPEPNEDEGQPVSQTEQDCSDGEDMFKGTLDGADDVDFHKYFGSFTNNCGFGDPEIKTRIMTTEPVRLCVYPRCPNGNETQFGCDDPETSAMSPTMNIKGCCVNAEDYEIVMTVNCANTGTESFDVFISVEDAPANACLDYTVKFSYDA